MVKTVSMFLRQPDEELIVLAHGAQRVTVTAVADNRVLVEGDEYTVEDGVIVLLIDPEPVLVQYQIGGDDE